MQPSLQMPAELGVCALSYRSANPGTSAGLSPMELAPDHGAAPWAEKKERRNLERDPGKSGRNA